MSLDLSEILKIEQLADFDQSWGLAKYVSSIIDRKEGRQILIQVLQIWNNVNENSKDLWTDLIERAGFYPYLDSIENNSHTYKASFQSDIRKQYYKSNYLPDVFFHEGQKKIEIALSKGMNVAVSAPTSFGKSLLIEEMVARKKYNNILVIQPTLALIDETRKKLSKYRDFYNIIVNTKQNVSENNIFILTSERVLEFPNLPKIDLFIIDEFYKISNRRNDSRIDSLNVALFKIMKSEPQSMFLTPSVDSLSKKFQSRYNIAFYKTDYSLVNTNIKEIRNKNGNKYKGKDKKRILFDLLSQQVEPSIVYVKSPNEAFKLAEQYIEYLGEKGKIVNPELSVYEWIDNNISPNWKIKRFLKFGIGAHSGSIPRHILTTEIELFNSGKLNILFATATLIEGVNTLAKNIFIFSDNKGKIKIDFFDYANIIGRAGRMNKYFTGNVYLFNEAPIGEVFEIDVPIIDQINVSDEILVNIPDKEVLDYKTKSELVSNVPTDIQKVMKKNMFNFRGQKELFHFLERNELEIDFLKWKDIPSYDDLYRTLSLVYKYLKNNSNDKYIKKQTVLCLKLIKYPVKNVIEDEKNYLNKIKPKEIKTNEDLAISTILHFMRNDASFEIPKLLSILEPIQRYIFGNSAEEESGDYSFFCAHLENGNVNTNLQFLIDYGIPSSALSKIGETLPDDLVGDEETIAYLKSNKFLKTSKLLRYEYDLLSNAIDLDTR